MGKWKTKTFNNMVIVACGKVYRYPLGYCSWIFYRNKGDYVQHGGKVGLGVLDLRISDTVIAPVKVKRRRKQRLKTKGHYTSSQHLPHGMLQM